MCRDVSDRCGAVLVRPASAERVYEHGRWHRHSLAASASLAGLGAPGGGVEVPGLLDPALAVGLDRLVPGDAEPAGGAAAGGELPGVDPVVDDAGAAAQPSGGLGHGDLAGAVGIRDRDLVGVADPLDRIDVEWPAVAGAVSGGIEPGGQLVVAGGRPEPFDQFDGGVWRAPGGAGVGGPVDG